jgi:hypothetical protein
MTTGAIRGRRWILGAFLVALGAFGIWAPDPDRHWRSALALHDFLHVPGSALATAVFLLWFPEPQGISGWGRVLRLLVLSGAGTAYGGIIELGQAAVGMPWDVQDIVRDAGGAAAATLIAASGRRDLRAATRWALGGSAVAVVGWFLLPTLIAFADEARARRQFPVLADFSRPSEITRFTWSSIALPTLERLEGGRGQLRLRLLPGMYPGLSFEYFPRDWRGWRALIVDCTNPEDPPVPLTVRIDDFAHNQAYSDRYTRTFVLPAGRSTIRIPLSEVASAPHGRPFELARVNSVLLFVRELREAREVLIHEVRLER